MSEKGCITCSAPGSIMLLGEHAVLKGGRALVAAIDRRITVELTARQDNNIVIHSEQLGDYQTALTDLTIVPPFTFVLAAIDYYRHHLHNGLTLNIYSDFSAKLGLGSSAAVTVATLNALKTYLQQSLSPLALIKIGSDIIRQVQGMGSGSDIAASVLGGVVAYRSEPIEAIKIAQRPEMTLIYSGSKMKTVEVVRHLDNLWQDERQQYQQHLATIAQCAEHGCHAAQQADWSQLAQQMTQQQQVMVTLQLTNKAIEEIISQLNSLPNVLAAKISGSGLGDCVVVLGKLPNHCFPQNSQQQQLGIEQVDVVVASEGVMYHAV